MRLLEKDHRDVLPRLRRFKSILLRWQRGGALRAPSEAREVCLFVPPLIAKTVPHFRTEEKIVFPYLKRHAPRLTTRLERIQAEHPALLRELAKLRKAALIFARKSASKAAVKRVSRQGLFLARGLHAHIQKEERLMRRFRAI